MTAKTDYYMLVRAGYTQRLQTERGLCWPIAETHRDADRLRDWIGKSALRVARIGSVEGETMYGHIVLAIEDGCSYVACVESWDEDGNPRWKMKSLLGREG